jgi:hypothetical protein
VLCEAARTRVTRRCAVARHDHDGLGAIKCVERLRELEQRSSARGRRRARTAGRVAVRRDHHLAIGAPAQPSDHVRELLLAAVHLGEEALPGSLQAQGAEAHLHYPRQSGITRRPGLPFRKPLHELAGVGKRVQTAERIRRQIRHLRSRTGREREHGDDERQQGGYE